MNTPHPDGFSDEDLKRLKDQRDDQLEFIKMALPRFDAFLHRLKCAEILLERLTNPEEDYKLSNVDEDYELYLAWLASKQAGEGR